VHQHVDVVAGPRGARQRGAEAVAVLGHEPLARSRPRLRDQPAEGAHAGLVVGHQEQLVARMEVDDRSGAALTRGDAERRERPELREEVVAQAQVVQPALVLDGRVREPLEHARGEEAGPVLVARAFRIGVEMLRVAHPA
jgi:hypothetical protein